MSGANWTQQQWDDHCAKLVYSPVDTHVTPATPAVKITKPKWNKWEAEYAQELDAEKAVGLIANWWFESVKFRLADSCWYCPDFLVAKNDGTYELHETKGHWRDDALVKVKVQAESYPFPLLVIRKRKIREGGGWEVIRRFEVKCG